MAEPDVDLEEPPSQQPIHREIARSSIIPSAPGDLPPPPSPYAAPDSYKPKVAAPPGPVEPEPPEPPIPPGRRNAVARMLRAQEDAREKYQDRLTRFNAEKMYAGQQQEKVRTNEETQNTLKNLHVATETDPETGLIRPERDEKGVIQFRKDEGPIAVEKHLHSAARDALGKDVYESALNLKQMQQTAISKQDELKQLRQQAADLEPKVGQTEGGMFGIFKHPTDEATASKTKLDEINGQIDTLQQAGYGKLTKDLKLAETPDVTEAKKNHALLTADKSAWGNVAPKELGDIDNAINERRASILAAGGDPSQDRVLSVIEAKKQELGIANQTPEMATAQAQVKPLQARSDKLMSRLESVLGVKPDPSAAGTDPEVRLRNLKSRIADLTDPAQQGRVQTLLNALEPTLEQLRPAKVALQQVTNANAHNGSQYLYPSLEDQQRILGSKAPALAKSPFDYPDTTNLPMPQTEAELNKYTTDGYRKLPENAVGIHPADPAKGVDNAVRAGAISSTDAEMHGPEVIKTATAAQRLSSQNPQADGTQPPVKTIGGMQATLERTALEGARGFDKSVEGIVRFADAFSRAQGNFSPEGGSLAKMFADYLKERTQKQAQALIGIPSDKGEKLSKESAEGASGVVSKVAGGLTGMAPGLAAGGIPGLMTMAAQAMGQSSAEARDIAINDGKSEANGDKAGWIAALKTLPTLALYGGAGKLTASIMKKIMPVGASPFFRAATTFAVQAPMNMAASSGGKLVVGEDPKPTIDSAITDAIFASLGTRDAYTHGKDVKIAQTMLSGEHPEIAVMNGIAANQTGAFKPEMQDLAQIYANRMRAIAEQFLKKFGEKIPATSTEGGVEPTKPAEKMATAREVPPEEASAPAEPTAPDVAPAHAEIDALSMPDKTPEEHVVTQHALRGLVKIAQGEPMEALNSVERSALEAKGPDGIARVEMVKGKPVITDSTLDRVRAVAPVTAQILPESEEKQRQEILNEEKPKPATTDSTGSDLLAGNKTDAGKGNENLPTFAVEVQNAKGETKVIEAKAATAEEAHSQVAQTIPPGQGLIKDVTQVSAPAEKAAAPKDFVENAVQQVTQEKGRALTPDEEKKTRVVARVVKPHVERWEKAFGSIQTTMHPSGGGGALIQEGGGQHLVISVPDVIAHHIEYAGNKEHAANVVTEEAVHAVTTSLENRDPKTGEARGSIDLVKIFKTLPPKIQEAVKSVYKPGKNDYQFAHEFWRMWMQGDLELQRGNKIKLKGKFLQEQTSRAFVVQNRKALATLLRFFRNMEGHLEKSGAGKDVISEVGRAQNLIRAKVKEVDAHSSPASEKGTSESPATQAAVSAEQHPARGPPAGKNEPGGVKGAGADIGVVRAAERTGGADEAQSKGALGAVEPAARAELANGEPNEIRNGTSIQETADSGSGPRARETTPSEKRAIAATVGTAESAVGDRSKVTQNGRTVNVAYVAQDASAARPSHDAQGRVTPGYDQTLQPRDRSLPQYRKQSQNIATNLDFEKSAFFPETTTPATTADLGAPVMTKAGDTLIGNGREIGIKAAYDQGLTVARKYKAEFVRNAAAFGIDPKAVMGMKAPILKRVLLDDLSKDELVRLSQESNEGAAMASNATEVANRDASRLNPQLLSLFDPNYGLDSAKNLDFLRAYQRDVVQSGTTANEANLTGGELTARIRRAVFSHAYGMDETGRAAMDRLAGDESDTGKTITNALLTVAPIMGRMRNDILTGTLFPGFDISPSVTRAAQDLSNALQNRPQNQSIKATIVGLLGQGNLFVTDPLDRSVLEFLVENRGKRVAIEEGLSNFAESVYGLGDPKQAQLFGDRVVPTAQELWQRATTPEALAPKTEERTLWAQELREALKSQPLQTFRAQEEAFASAERAKPAFDRTLEEIARVTGTRAIIALIKSRESAVAKVTADYNGDWSQIKDLVRGTIAVRNIAQAKLVVGALAQRFGAEPKRDFTQPLPNGYRDALFNLVIDGHTAEVQLQFEQVVFVKDVVAHPLYEREREIERQAKLENRQLSAQELRTVERLTLAQRRIYAAAFAGHIDSGISSTASEGLQGRASSDLISSSVTGRGLSSSNAQAVPSLSTTIPQAPSGLEGSVTSMKYLAPGKVASAASSVIAPSTTRTGAIGQREFERAMQTLRSQPIADSGEKIRDVAVRMKEDGRIFTGRNHWDAADKIPPLDGGRLSPAVEFEGMYDEGFTTTKGRFLDREEAFRLAKQYLPKIQSGSLGDRKPWLESEKLDRAISTLSSQQLSLFGDSEPVAAAYAKTLPAAAKSSRPALKSEVAKDVPELSDNEAALAELFTLANEVPKSTTVAAQEPEAPAAKSPVATPASDVASEGGAQPTIAGDSEQLSGKAVEAAPEPSEAVAVPPAQQPTRVAVGSVDTPAQVALNQARELKSSTWKNLTDLRERVKDAGPQAGNLRLDLLKASSAHREAVRMERDALDAIERRANELGQTTKSTIPRPPEVGQELASLLSQPALPKKPVSLTAHDENGNALKIEMPADVAGRRLTQRASALQALVDCLGGSK